MSNSEVLGVDGCAECGVGEVEQRGELVLFCCRCRIRNDARRWAFEACSGAVLVCPCESTNNPPNPLGAFGCRSKSNPLRIGTHALDKPFFVEGCVVL